MATPIRLETQEEKELWKSVCVAVASSSNTTGKYTMYEWADKAIEYFRERTTHETGRPNPTKS